MMHSLGPPSSNVKRLLIVSAVTGFLSLGLSCLIGGILEVFFTQDSFLAQSIPVPSLDQQTHLGPLIVAIGASIVTLPGLILAIIVARRSERKTDAVIAILLFTFIVLSINVAIWSIDAFTNFEPCFL